MATYNNIFASKTATLVAATADTVNFTNRPPYVFVTNNGAGVIYARTDGVAPSSTGANDGDVAVLSGATVAIPTGAPFEPVPNLLGLSSDPVPVTAGAVVKLISAGTPTYTVTR